MSETEVAASTAVGTFALSAVVAVLSTFFSRWQANAVSNELAEQFRSALESGQMSIGGEPAVFRAWVAQALDVAINFPAAILTLVAYLDLPALHGASSWVTVIVATIITLGSVVLAQPRLAGYYDRFAIHGVSAFSILIVAVNIAGLTVALSPG